ncbi:hypothetical protein D9615_005735 [Tricholomella constricta]|uniref:PNPLA domain-containing protein n=1 Tax=Tricholomella constricta TaxID=117010 RepID=A0A8H5HAL2_9AGAR|nr:hypothetical protein D9615_005735 [Tricholomella constricta]
MSFTVEKDKYIVSATTPCSVVSDSNQVTSEIWFRTPALDQDIVDKVVQIQLETKSRDQGWVSIPDAGSWSWFDIIVLESSESSEPKVKDNMALVWLSHENKLGSNEYEEQVGALSGKHDIFNGLEVGNALAVRVCARFVGWENHAVEGRLVLKLSEKGRPAQPSFDEYQIEYLGVVAEQMSALGKALDTYLDAATPEGAPPAYSLVREILPTGPLRADQSALADEPPLRLLSLDGGGVRGISSLYILKAIMAKVSSDSNVKPCQYFDMMAGTSTGGLIAIMLGRLQMTIPECIEAYINMASKIFSATPEEKSANFKKTGVYYKKDNLEKVLKDIIRQKTGDENAPMLDPDTNNRCKVFVVAGLNQDLNHTSAEHFRTYPTKIPNPFGGSTIWQAARATSAAPLYLPSIEINGQEFLDGGLRFANPSLLLVAEVNDVYGAGFGIARRVDCFLTIGAGMSPKIIINKPPSGLVEVLEYWASIAKAVKNLATDCQTTHLLAQSTTFCGKLEEVYFRFSAGVRQGDDWAPLIDLDDYEGMPGLVKITQTYLEGETTRVGQCALKLMK